MDPYENLAYAICKSACEEYVDALILVNRGWLRKPSEEIRRKKTIFKRLWKTTLAYGKCRWKCDTQRKNSTKTQRKKKKETKNKPSKSDIMCERISNLLYQYDHHFLAERSVIDCEKFFRSDSFSIFMPKIDPEDLIRELRKKAMRGERIERDNIQGSKDPDQTKKPKENLDGYLPIGVVAKMFGVTACTLRKGIYSGKLQFKTVQNEHHKYMLRKDDVDKYLNREIPNRKRK